MQKPSLHDLRYYMAALCMAHGIYHHVAGYWADPHDWLRVLVGVLWITNATIWMAMNALTDDYQPR